MITKAIGILAAACFAFCGVPAAVRTYYEGGTIGTPISVALAIFVGAISMYYYLCKSFGFDLVLSCTYVLEIVSWGTIVWFHYFPRKPFA